ncbi:hypothetical protein SDRG_12618 [Saprolegnia diclina VS20]|uniref:Trichohyalin-plectin-homology domain-containing protein n=1 Tax=Saprolegnia diclina (strain VS20) TaxID=1156394 RepID=T0RIE3_SAPDV|nr:hypothetical protein SDRG_12618 [Saprolegnia diclina VS20]EQC29612.1 hypothetical protein SDRG_12618 [Saprolegnia diclina VS20]|eukprot:XP_008616916.1 hypothetical protein SDRG_12618 [Saprolegnia diclina VS20]
MPVTITEADLARILRNVSEPEVTNREAKRAQLRELSQTRTNKWPNTLEAMRRKKENWKKDKEDREEDERRKVDMEEARLQIEARTRQIERANRLLYEQTDKMKTLRSKELLNDVLADREFQLAEKAALAAMDKRVEDQWIALERTQLADADAKKAADEARRHAQSLALAAIQKTQLDEYKTNFIATLREEKRDGERIKAKAEQDNRDEDEAEAARKRKSKQASEDTRLANERLKALRAREKELEYQEDLKREEDAQKKEARVAKREALQRQKEERKTAQKMRMIDLATANLLKVEQKSEARLENQKKEVRLKEDTELKHRADRRAAQKRAIDHSRAHQLSEKARAKEEERAAAKEQMMQWAEYNRSVEQALVHEENERRLDNMKLAALQQTQAHAKRSLDMEERAAQILAEETIKISQSTEQELYTQYASQVLAAAEARGVKNTFPLKQAMKAKNIDLLPAGGFRI